MRHDISKVLVPPAASMTASAPRPSAASRTAASIFPISKTLASSALSANPLHFASSRRCASMSIAMIRAGFARRAHIMVARLAGPAPMTATVEPGSISAIFAPHQPVAKISPRNRASSSSTPSGMGAHVLSAKGTRMNSAWQPSIRQPSSQLPWMQLFTHPRRQKKHSRALCGVRPPREFDDAFAPRKPAVRRFFPHCPVLLSCRFVFDFLSKRWVTFPRVALC